MEPKFKKIEKKGIDVSIVIDVAEHEFLFIFRFGPSIAPPLQPPEKWKNTGK